MTRSAHPVEQEIGTDLALHSIVSAGILPGIACLSAIAHTYGRGTSSRRDLDLLPFSPPLLCAVFWRPGCVCLFWISPYEHIAQMKRHEKDSRRVPVGFMEEKICIIFSHDPARG
jgi:hypothetical protein